jgi:hypothetical protein
MASLSARYVPERAWNLLRRKFPALRPGELTTVVEELVKYLLLAADAETLFFPGDQLMDDVWHALIVETRLYVELCERICPGRFLHHSGETIESYVDRLGAPRAKEEQLSWLASYVAAFGGFSAEAVEHLTLARHFMTELGLDLGGLNRMAKHLGVVAAQGRAAPTSALQMLADLGTADGDRFDTDRFALARALRDLMSVATDEELSPESEVGNAVLERAYAVSGALGFTLLQTVTALERVLGATDWCSANSELAAAFHARRSLIGLATTHLAKRGGPGIRGERVDGGYVLTGTAPWVTGFGIFEHLAVGSMADDGARVQVVAAFQNGRGVVVKHGARLVAMEATNTVSVHFERFRVEDRDVLLRREGPVDVTIVPPSRFPELGLADAALALCEETGRPATDSAVREAAERLKAWVADIRHLVRANPPAGSERLVWDQTEVIRQATRLAVMCSAGSGMRLGSTANRLVREAMILDAVYQPRPVWETKCRHIGSRSGC